MACCKTSGSSHAARFIAAWFLFKPRWRVTLFRPLCATPDLRTKGHIIDYSVRCPTSGSYLSGSSSAAFQDGHAAAAGERQKISHHSGRYNKDRYQFVPFIQETYGRLGQKAASFVRELATHSAQYKGGSTAEIQRRYARVLVGIRSELSVTLARALSGGTTHPPHLCTPRLCWRLKGALHSPFPVVAIVR
eukprot:1086-Heterococcus_DN1.PRE.2